MKILVVEDDPVSGTLLKKILSKQGYDVTHVSDGAKAMSEIGATLYRIVVTDWMMPEMDGPTLCRHIRGLNQSQHTYIILLTSKDSKSDAVSGLEAGADDYIVKPIDKEEFLARIRVGQRLVELEDRNLDTLQKLSRTEKLAAVGQLAAGVAHEINNPIGFINSNLRTLQEYIHDIREILVCYKDLTHAFDQSITQKQLLPELPSLLKQCVKLEDKYQLDFLITDADELITDCKDGADRVKNIVHEMRYFAHPDQQIIEPSSMVDIINRITSFFTPKLPPGVTIFSTMDDLPKVECNASHIEQVFSNLIKNALDAAKGDGQVTVSGRLDNNRIEIKVSDNGQGIAAEHLSKVFDPFFTTKEIGKGVGLGLTTALNIIKMHNGSITAESNPGEATTFTVGLPLTATTT